KLPQHAEAWRRRQLGNALVPEALLRLLTLDETRITATERRAYSFPAPGGFPRTILFESRFPFC
ncbi:MAG TPA: hypothetical protein VM940_17050, partial [Chthoniobacterales bacterium]|nr:hypothetical protein [Chthoniobacterales bacterium]